MTLACFFVSLSKAFVLPSTVTIGCVWSARICFVVLQYRNSGTVHIFRRDREVHEKCDPRKRSDFAHQCRSGSHSWEPFLFLSLNRFLTSYRSIHSSTSFIHHVFITNRRSFPPTPERQHQLPSRTCWLLFKAIQNRTRAANLQPVCRHLFRNMHLCVSLFRHGRNPRTR